MRNFKPAMVCRGIMTQLQHMTLSFPAASHNERQSSTVLTLGWNEAGVVNWLRVLCRVPGVAGEEVRPRGC